MHAPADVKQTSPPADGVPVLLYDGQCTFCIGQIRRLEARSRGRFVTRSFHDEDALDPFPGLTIEACMKEMKFIDSNGRVAGGIEAAVRSLAWAHPVVGRLLYLYYIPGIRWASDQVYAWVARNRYRLAVSRGEQCDTGSCGRHIR